MVVPSSLVGHRTSQLGGFLLALGIVSNTVPGRAESLRLHATAGLSHAVGGHQGRELSFGMSGSLAAELPIARMLGVEIEGIGLWLADGKAPTSDELADGGAATAGGGGLGIRLRPFAWEPPPPAPPERGPSGFVYAVPPKVPLRSGLFAAGSAGAVQTGGLTRPYFKGEVGWDFWLRGMLWGLGPEVSYVQVLQPNDELRPADAHVLTVGAHGVFDFGRRGEPSPKERDTDLDGIFDSVDECPTVPEDKDGFRDADGCPELDNDEDTIEDADDRCPLVAEDRDQFEDADGCPDPDNDQDGVLDGKDKCPLDPEDKDGFEDADGCPDPDNDQDGFPDPEDLCPNEPETRNGYADHDGCPDEEQVRVVGDRIVLDDTVHFGINSAVIRRQSYSLLERLTKLLADHPEYVHIHIEGHTDSVGDEEYNRQLSERRALSVQEFLVEHGIEAPRLSHEGFGESRPRAEGDAMDERVRFLNRRVEFRVTRAKAKSVGGESPSAAAPPPVQPAEAGKDAEQDAIVPEATK